jgi:hypothetical protein
MANEPWSIELLRRMTRGQFNARVKAGDLPPVDLAMQLMTERLGRRVDKISNSGLNRGD